MNTEEETISSIEHYYMIMGFIILNENEIRVPNWVLIVGASIAILYIIFNRTHISLSWRSEAWSIFCFIVNICIDWQVAGQNIKLDF